MRKKFLCLFMVFAMIFSTMPAMAFAVEGEEAGEEKFNPTQYVTAEDVFKVIKGQNSSMNSITSDLIDEIDGKAQKGSDIFAYVNPTTKKVERWADMQGYGDKKNNVKLEWVRSSAPEYIGVTSAEAGSTSKILKLRKRPVLAEKETAKELTLEAKLTELWGTARTKNLSIPLKITPGERIKTPTEWVKQNLFNFIRGDNESAEKIKSSFKNIDKGKTFIDVGEDGTLVSKTSQYTAECTIVYTSSNTDVYNISTNTLTQPDKDTSITITAKITERASKKTEEFPINIVVQGKNASAANALDVITEDLIFKAIKGENASRLEITKPLRTKGINDVTEFYAKVKDDGTFDKWWGVERTAKACIKLKNISSDILAVASDKEGIDIVKVPDEDTEVTVTFTVTEVGKPSNKKEIPIKLTVKAAPKASILDAFTADNIFEAIKGDNLDSGNIYSELKVPAGVMSFDNMVAVVSDGKILSWKGGEAAGAPTAGEVKVSLQNINSEYIALNEAKNAVEIKKLPVEDSLQNLTFTVTDPSTNDSRNIVVPLTIKGSAAAATKARLQNALDTYLQPEKVTYTTYKKEGTSFIDDYKNNNVRFSVQLPNVTSEAGFGWKEAKTDILFDEDAFEQNKSNVRVLEPIRSDVGGEAKKTTVTYKLTKDGISAAKSISFTIPALTSEEIAEEVRLMEDAKKNIFDGVKYNNYDKDNITDSLSYTVNEVHYDKDGKLEWINDAKLKKYYGLKLPDKESWNVQYPAGGGGIFNSSNMVLEHRPTEDTKVVATHSIESIQLNKYIALYPNNAELQKLKNQTVTVEMTVKAVNANWDSIKVGNTTITPVEDVNEYSVLTNDTLEKTNVEVVLQNKGAKLVIDGTDCTHKFSKEVTLADGFAQFTVAISDEDSKTDGTKVTKNVKLVVASKTYLESNIAKLPEYSKAKADDMALAQKLWNQYSGLSAEHKVSIKGHEKLEDYGKNLGSYKETLEKELALAKAKLFDGIKGENNLGNKVYTDLEAVNFGTIIRNGANEATGVNWTKDADNSNIKIDWISSDKSEYVNTHNSNDFDGRYVEAFKLNKRPNDKKSVTVTFKAKLTHMADPSVTADVDVTFELLPYDASLKEVKIDEFPSFALKEGVEKYTITNSANVGKINLRAVANIPNAKITVNGTELKTGKTEINLAGDATAITIQVNDGVRNTLNEKWAEKIYTISIIKSVEALKAEIDALPDADKITKENYKDYQAKVDSLSKSYDVLSEEQKKTIGAESKDKLDAAKAKIADLALDAEKEKYIKELKEYYNDPTEFIAENWKKVEDIRNGAINDIRNATTKEAVISAYAAARKSIYAIPRTTSSTSADTLIKSITVLPGDYKASKQEDGNYAVTVPANVDKVRVQVLTTDAKATTEINKTIVTPENYWTSSETFGVGKGENIQIPVKVTSSDEKATKEYTLTISRSGSTVEAENISVSFELVGDSKHGDKPHQNFETWIARSTYTVAKGTTLKALTEKLFIDNNLSFVSNGSYVSSIKGLGELDNGKNSGWMFSVNGAIPNKTYNEVVLKNGDAVKWFYTDDYTKDVSGSGWGKAEGSDVTTSGAAGSGTTTAPTEVAVTEKTNVDGVKESVAAVTVKKENQTEILKQAKENRSKEIVLTVAAAASKGADSIQLELPKDMVSDIVRNTQAEVTVDAEHGALTLDRETLAQIAKEAKGSALTLTIHKAKIATEAQQKLTGAATQVYRLTLASANQNISQFDGRITVKLPIPAMLLEKTVAAVHFDSAEKFTQMQGKRESRNKQDFYVFATTHFSEFGLVDAEEAGITEKDAQEPETDKLSDRKEAKKIVSKMRLTTTASKTKKQSVKLQMKQSKKTRKDIKALQSLGYNVKYRFFRSTKKSKDYRRLTTKKTNAYTSVKGKKGTRYYYKTQLCVYDKEGKLIAKTALKQSKYAEKVWTKKAKA